MAVRAVSRSSGYADAGYALPRTPGIDGRCSQGVDGLGRRGCILSTNNSNAKVGLVLSGGGARAAYEVGVLKALYGAKCPSTDGQPAPEVFCGTGAGGFNAAVIASRMPNQYPSPIEYLESLWADEIPREGMMRNNRVYRRRLDTLQFLDIPFMW